MNLTTLKFKYYGENFFISLSPGDKETEVAFKKQLLST
ncbi:MAG: hypothetical protein IEMM0006_0775 [bacterium]|nr:MAG: hypothetical protein IEMM0006_0775 [bacterium]